MYAVIAQVCCTIGWVHCTFPPYIYNVPIHRGHSARYTRSVKTVQTSLTQMLSTVLSMCSSPSSSSSSPTKPAASGESYYLWGVEVGMSIFLLCFPSVHFFSQIPCNCVCKSVHYQSTNGTHHEHGTLHWGKIIQLWVCWRPSSYCCFAYLGTLCSVWGWKCRGAQECLSGTGDDAWSTCHRPPTSYALHYRGQ